MNMKPAIDCLFIGHNEMDFCEYEKMTRQMGTDSGAYRDLNLNYLCYNNKPYPPAGIFKLLNSGPEARFKPFTPGETFSPAIAYLGSYLHRKGFTFDYINSFREEQAVLAARLEREKILAIAIITTLYVSALPIVEIIDFIRTYNRTAKIIVGGPFVSTQVRVLEWDSLEYLFNHTLSADFFINSAQGEAALCKLLAALKQDSPLEQVENLFYKVNGQLRSTPMVREVNRLIENPVNWDLFPVEDYEYFNIRTAISCPFSCAFCGFPQHAGQYQTMPVEMIQRELDQLVKGRRIRSIFFIDDTFNVPVQRFKEILRLLIRKGYSFGWHSYLRCQYIDREMVKLMKDSGCEGVFLGIESGSDRVLKNMNKGSGVEKYHQGIALLNQYGIVTFGSFILGFPGETRETAAATKAFIRDSGLDFYRAQLWYCEPITPVWNDRKKYKIEGESFEWHHAKMDSPTACDLIEEIFLDIKTPVWIPQYNFDFDGLWHLVHRGMSMEQVKKFLNAFHKGVKEKLSNPKQKEVGYEVLKDLKTACLGENTCADISKQEENLMDKYNAGFDY